MKQRKSKGAKKKEDRARRVEKARKRERDRAGKADWPVRTER